MNSSQQDFAANYRDLADDDIAALHAEIDSLTEEARAALLAEIKQRGLAETQLQKLHSTELRREERFDRREHFRRKRMVLERLGRHDPKGWIFAVLGAALLALLFELISRRH